MTLVDAHVHLPSFEDGRQVALNALSAAINLVSCTVDWSEAEENLKLAVEFQSVRCFLGVHPSCVGKGMPSDRLGALWSMADGVGEIGLDPKYSGWGPGGLQEAAFAEQLGAAERLGKPVQVHSRKSEHRSLEILSSYTPRSVLMHWFEGEEETREVAARGYYVSFGPALLYSKKLKRIAALLPQESVLSESDGPVEFVQLGGIGGPNLVASVVFTLAEVRGVSFEEMEQTVERNAASFLGNKTLNSTT